MKKRAINFEMPEDIFLQLKEVADNNDRSVASQIRIIINSYLKENKGDGITEN